MYVVRFRRKVNKLRFSTFWPNVYFLRSSSSSFLLSQDPGDFWFYCLSFIHSLFIYSYFSVLCTYYYLYINMFAKIISAAALLSVVSAHGVILNAQGEKGPASVGFKGKLCIKTSQDYSLIPKQFSRISHETARWSTLASKIQLLFDNQRLMPTWW